jgi:hypothetical protein
MMWRQGDVLIDRVEAVPQGATPRPDVVLARGEMTGHNHQVKVPETAQLWELDGVLYMKVVAPTATIVHEEHKPITLTEGIYRVWMQREYTARVVRPIFD